MHKNTSSQSSPKLEDSIQVRLVRLVEIIAQFAKQTTKSNGLGNSDLRILNILDDSNGISVNEIARRAHVDKAWISRSLYKLEKKEMITRRGSSNDSRLSLIHLTGKSKSMLDTIRPLVIQREKDLLKGIDSKLLKQQLNQLMINAEAILEESKNTRG